MAVSYTHLDVYKRQLYTEISGTNTMGSDASPISIAVAAAQGVSPAYEKLVDLAVKLDEANVPKACLLYTSRCV